MTKLQWQATAVLIALQLSNDKFFKEWATRWIIGTDRSELTAREAAAIMCLNTTDKSRIVATSAMDAAAAKTEEEAKQITAWVMMYVTTEKLIDPATLGALKLKSVTLEAS